MHDDLIGYVLGLLEAEEELTIGRLVETDAEVRTHIEILRHGLTVFEAAREHHNAPEGLALRTCQRLRSAAENP